MSGRRDAGVGLAAAATAGSDRRASASPTVTRFRLLWHEFVVEDPAGDAAAGSGPRWPWPPEVTVHYRVERRPSGRLLFEQGDAWTTCPPEEMPALLADRAAGRALELAELKGWTPFLGTVLSRGGMRTCLVGPAQARAAAAAARVADGWAVDSTAGWVSRDGVVLPVPDPYDEGDIGPAPVAGIECCAPVPAFAGLLAAAAPRCTARPAVVREVAALLRVTA